MLREREQERDVCGREAGEVEEREREREVCGREGDAMESVHDDRPGKPLWERAKMALNAGLGFSDSQVPHKA